MAETPNIYVSNGTCYTGPDLEADPAMIPCGNAYYQPQACCQYNDNCLESSVCYNSDHGVTYVAGCTDKEYNATVCPDKFDDAGELGQTTKEENGFLLTRETKQGTLTTMLFPEAPWLGMAYCDDNSNNWVLCDQKGHPGTIVNPDPCACPTATAQRSMTLNQAQGIQETASLPGATGLPIGWNTDFYPTIPSSLPQPTASSSSSIRPATTTASSTSSAEPTPNIASNIPSPPYPTGFNTSAKIGTAIGASVFGIILLALIGFFVLRRRQPSDKQRNDNNLHGAGEKGAPSANPNPDGPDSDPRTIGVAYGSGTLDVSQLSINAGSPRPSELENKAARPWSMISELDNDYDGCGGSGGKGHMEAIMEASHGQNLGRGHTRSQSEPGPSELEAPRGVVELPG